MGPVALFFFPLYIYIYIYIYLYLAEEQRNELKRELEQAKLCSVPSDGSTDTAMKEEELVYTRFCTRGEVKVRFVGIQDVEKADCAHSSSYQKPDGQCEGWEEKLVACATDGAEVMTGLKTRVVTRLQGDKDYVLRVHCKAHRQELAISDAMKKNPMFQRVEELLSGLFTFYHTSPLNRANLVNTFQTLKATPLIPTRIGGTRWVGQLHMT